MSAGSSLPETETPARPKPRIESLSDLIFGLALSVGAITLVSNVGGIRTTQALLGDIAVFGFSFLILISVWMRYTKIMSVLPLENRWTISLNADLLFTVSLEPFLFNVMQLGFSGIKDVASRVYVIDLGVMMVILSGFTFVLADKERNLIPKDSTKEFKVESITMFVAGEVFFVSILEIFWTRGPNRMFWRFYLWIIPFAISSIRRRTMTIIGRIKKVREKSV